tara:strand:- start:247 stop:1134 length:888 start_codon:yes stop_codon:yes gene_type:complete
MGFKLSRKIRHIRNSILQKIKKKNLKLYKLLLFVGAIFKFLYKFNKKKIKKVYSKNLDEINKYEFKKTSQNNEDGIIYHLFQRLNLNYINFIEIGFDYYENNSLNFLKKVKKGLFVDGSEEKTFLLKNLLLVFFPFKKINVLNTFVNKDNINQIISNSFKTHEEIDFLSIDIDGMDYYILENLKYSPKILCIEYNFWYGSEVKCSIPYSENFEWEPGSLYSGASLLAMCSLAKRKDYHLVALDSACVNAFFVRGNLKKNFEVLDPIESFKLPSKYNLEEIKFAEKQLLSRELIFF